jgi:hypothetical protein
MNRGCAQSAVVGHDRLPEAGRLLAPASAATARGKARRVQEFGRLLATPAQLPQKPPRVAEMIPSVLGESGDATRCQRPRVAPRCSWTALDPALDGWEIERLPPWSAPGVLQSHAAPSLKCCSHRLTDWQWIPTCGATFRPWFSTWAACRRCSTSASKSRRARLGFPCLEGARSVMLAVTVLPQMGKV